MKKLIQLIQRDLYIKSIKPQSELIVAQSDLREPHKANQDCLDISWC